MMAAPWPLGEQAGAAPWLLQRRARSSRKPEDASLEAAVVARCAAAKTAGVLTPKVTGWGWGVAPALAVGLLATGLNCRHVGAQLRPPPYSLNPRYAGRTTHTVFNLLACLQLERDARVAHLHVVAHGGSGE